MTRVCLVPRLSGVGGMVSFQDRLVQGFARHGVEVSLSLSDTPYQAVLIIGGTRDLAGLWRARQRGVRLVQRLDGMNWLQRKIRTGARHFWRAESGNLLLALIRTFLADRVVYQSHFSRGWWERVYGPTRCPWQVIYNAVDLTQYTPYGPGERPSDRYRLLVVEGNLAGGYEIGLETTVALGERLQNLYHLRTEIMVVGRISSPLQSAWQKRTGLPLHFAGRVPGWQIPEIDRSAHLLYAADLNAACPNSVIEAMACGLPVVAFDTGALSELVRGEAGRLTPYGGNPWNLDPPNLDGLSQAAAEVLADQPRFRAGARRRAEEAFGLDEMVSSYLQAMTGE